MSSRENTHEQTSACSRYISFSFLFIADSAMCSWSPYVRKYNDRFINNLKVKTVLILPESSGILYAGLLSRGLLSSVSRDCSRSASQINTDPDACSHALPTRPHEQEIPRHALGRAAPCCRAAEDGHGEELSVPSDMNSVCCFSCCSLHAYSMCTNNTRSILLLQHHSSCPVAPLAFSSHVSVETCECPRPRSSSCRCPPLVSEPT